MKPVRFLLVYTLLLSLLACANLGGYKLEEPRIDIADIRVLDVGLFQQRYALTLNVQNPNARAIPVQGLSYRLDLAGAQFARGVSSKDFTLPAYGETTVEVEMTTNLASAARQVRALLEGKQETLDYELTGKFEVPRFGTVPFTNAGKIDFAGVTSQ